MKVQFYFKDEFSECAHPLAHFIEKAKKEGLAEITLFEAIPENDNPHFIYCCHVGVVGDREECSKSRCEFYESKSGRGVCRYRGKLFTKGERIMFKVE